MPRNLTEEDRVHQKIIQCGLIRSRDLTGSSDRMHLKRLCEKGKVQRVARGIYASAEYNLSELSSLAIVSLIAPKAVICLVSALQFYELTTQMPWKIWMAIPQNSTTYRIPEYNTQFIWYSQAMLNSGVSEVTIDGVLVRVFNPAKTIVDCFKFRNKIGTDVCLESLQEGWRRGLYTIDDLWQYAGICRVKTVIRPYLEMLQI